MSSPVTDALTAARQGLRDALAVVSDVRVAADLGSSVKPPALVVGPPGLTFDAYTGTPTIATFVVGLIVRDDAQALDRLFALLPGVLDAIHAAAELGAVVTSAEPGTWPAGGGSNLPAYLLEVEVPL